MFLKILPLALAIFSASALAADWPQWRGPLRTGHVPAGEPVPATLPADPKVIWQVPLGEGFASPVISGGRVFILDNQDAQEVAHAFDAGTGRELWRAKIFSSHRDGFGIGPRTTPLADGNRVFFQSAKGEFQCLDARDGKLIWRMNFVDDLGAIYIGEKGNAAGASRHGATGSPLIDGGNVIAQAGSANGASIVAFDKTTGKVVWKSQNDQTSYSAPIVAEIAGVRQFIAFTIEGLIGLDPRDGRLLWRRPMTTRLGRHVTTPLVVGDVVVVASHQLGLVGTRIVREGAGFAAQEAWLDKDVQTNFSSPVAAGDFLYGLGSKKDVICVNAKTGAIAWQQADLISTSADKSEAAFLVMGSNIAMLTDGGQFVLFAADPKAFREIARTQVCGTNWCNPAYAGGRLYVRDARELRCVELLK